MQYLFVTYHTFGTYLHLTAQAKNLSSPQL